MEGIGEAIDTRLEISVGVGTDVIDVRDLVRAACSKVALQQIVSRIEAIRNTQSRRAGRGVYLTEIHALMNPYDPVNSLAPCGIKYSTQAVPPAANSVGLMSVSS